VRLIVMEISIYYWFKNSLRYHMPSRCWKYSYCTYLNNW